MSLIKWNPVNRMDLFHDFDSMINDFFFRPSQSLRRGEASGWAPRVDVLEKEKEYQLIAELPGMEKKDIDISVKDDVLTISGEKKFEDETRDENYYSCERRFGKFERSFRMAERIESGKIDAQYKNGVLTVTVPKSETPVEQSHKINIK